MLLSVILSDPSCKDGNARFTTVSLKLYLINVVEDIVVFFNQCTVDYCSTHLVRIVFKTTIVNRALSSLPQSQIHFCHWVHLEWRQHIKPLLNLIFVVLPDVDIPELTSLNCPAGDLTSLTCPAGDLDLEKAFLRGKGDADSGNNSLNTNR